jgi:hypothetical protein
MQRACDTHEREQKFKQLLGMESLKKQTAWKRRAWVRG